MRAILVGLAVCLLAALDAALAGCAPAATGREAMTADGRDGPPPSVVVATEAYVDEGDAKHFVDVYAPARAGASSDGAGAPVFVFFHGGVWQGGDRSRYAHLGEALAARGVVTVVAGYRLTPRVVHPAHVEDAAAAVAWTLANAARFGGDPARVVVGGHSAGGHLATLLLFDATWLARHDVVPTRLAGVLPLSGVFDLQAPLDDTATGGVERFVHPPFSDDPDALRAASPIAHVARTTVPVHVVVAGDDYAAMRAQSERFVAALRAAGNAPTYEVVAGFDHFALVAEPDERVLALLASLIAR